MYLIFVILSLLFLFFYLKTKKKYESFQDFKYQEKYLKEFIKDKTSPGNLLNMPLLNNIDPTEEINKRISGFQEVEEKKEKEKEIEIHQ